MSDVNAIINIDINSSSALTNLKKLEAEINQFNRSVSATNATSVANQASLNRALLDGINNTGLFTAKQISAIDSSTRFSNALEKNKLTLGEYAKFASSQLPGMSKIFRREFDTMEEVATSRVKRMNSQYLALGKTVDGITRAIQSTPTGLGKGYSTDVAVAAQKQMMFNKLIDDGSTKLLNWGKNTQWAGRQLMVGLTLPLAAMGAASAKAFMEIDKASVALRRVYGDLSTTTVELENNVDGIKKLGAQYTKYGIAVSETINIAARAAATGATNEKLMAETEQTLRFATLGQIDYNQALDTTIAMQTAFGISNEDLASNIDYLNAVENQTILTIEDMSLAIPRVATVIKGLGGDVKDLAVFMTAMREGGVSAENAANGLKSGLASMINPTKQASEYLGKFGINLEGIVNANQGNLVGTVQEFGKELDKLSDMDRQRALEKTFGKYQYARMSALFTNMAKGSSQAARAMDIAGMSAEDLASISEKELGKISESTTVKFQAALEQLKLSIAPIGEAFLKLATPVIEVVSRLADIFNNLPDPIKNAMGIATAAIAGLGPILLMGIGLMGNLIANITKGIQWWRKLGARVRGDASAFTFLESAQLDANAATHALEGSTQSLTGKLNLQAGAVNALTAEYERFAIVAGTASGAMAGAGGRRRGKGGTAPLKMATGGVVPGTGSGDKIPALLEPGEMVVTKDASQKYGSVIAAMNAGTLPGYSQGNAEDVGFAGMNLPRSSFAGRTPTSAGFETMSRAFATYLQGAENSQELQTQFIQRMTKIAETSQITNEDIKATLRSITKQEGMFSDRGARRGEGGGKSSAPSYIRSQSTQFAGTQMFAGEEQYIKGLLGDAINPDMFKIDASHIEKQLDENGKKLWNPENLLPDFSGVNKTLNNRMSSFNNAIKQGTISVEKTADLMIENTPELLKDLSADAVRAELENLRKGIHPVTVNATKVATSFAQLDVALSQAAILKGEERTALGTIATTSGQSAFLAASGEYRLGPGREEFFGAGGRSQQRYSSSQVASARKKASETATAVGRDDIGKPVVDGAKSPEALDEHSASKAMAVVADDAAKGILVGAKRSKKFAYEAGKLLGLSARDAYKTEMSQLRADMRNIGIMEAGGMTNATQQTRTLEKISRSKERPALVAAGRAGKVQRQAEAQRKNAEAQARREEARKQREERIKQNAADRKVAAEERLKNIKRENRKSLGRSVGKNVNRGAGVMGMASMIPFMAQNDEGKFMGMDANALGMGMMGASMAAPMIGPAMSGLATGATALAGSLGVATAAVAAPVAALAAVAVGAYLLKKSFDNNIQAGKEYADALTTSVEEQKSVADLFGNKTYAQRRKESGIKKVTGLTSKQQEKSKEFAATDQGKKMVEEAKIGFEQSGRNFASTLGTQLSQMVISGAINPEQARVMAAGITDALGKQDVTANVIAQISQILGPNGTDVTNSPLKIAAEITASIIQDEKTLESKMAINPMEQYSGAGGFIARTFGGNYDEAAKLSVAYSEAVLNSSKSIQSTYDDQIMAQDDLIKSLHKQGKEEKNATKKKEITAKENAAIRQKNSLLEKKDVVEKQRRVKEMASLSTSEAINAARSTLEQQAPGMNAAALLRVSGEKGTGGVLGSIREGQLGQQFTEEQANQFEISWLVDLRTGRIDPIALQVLQSGEENKAGTATNTLSTIVELQAKGDVEEANKIAMLSSTLDTEIRTVFDAQIKGDSPESIIQYATVLNQISDLPPEIYKKVAIELGGMNEEQLKKFTGQIESLQNLNVDVVDLLSKGGVKGLQNAAIAMNNLSSGLKKYKKEIDAVDKIKTKNGKIEKIIEIEQKILNDKGQSIDPKTLKDMLPKIAKDANMTEADFLLLPTDTIISVIDMRVQAEGMLTQGNALIAAGRMMGNPAGAALAAQGASMKAAAEAIMAGSTATASGTVPPVSKPADDTGDGNGGGGGGAKENPLLDLKKSILEQIQMYSDMTAKMSDLNTAKTSFANIILKGQGIFDKLRGIKGQGGIDSATMQRIMDMGPEASKKWLAKNTKKNKKGEDVLTRQGQREVNQMQATAIKGTITENVTAFETARAQKRAATNLRGKGVSDAVTQSIANDPTKAMQLEVLQQKINAGVKGAKKAYWEFVDAEKAAVEEAELLARAQDPIQTQIDDMTMAHRIITNEIDDQIDKYQDQVDLINKEIDSLQDMNKADQNRIRDLDRQKEMINRQIETLSRANELDQRRADSLKRQDEIRNRASDALSHDLDIMSQEETKIKEAYDKRIKALDEVAKINSYIISQQQSQLGLAQALSEGDVYAAAAAAQSMQAQGAQFAQEQMRTGLQSGMENQIASLQTAGGLTREEAEAQIAATKEQSYQTSLQIRDIEDAIYQRNLEMIPLKDSQLAIDGQIQVIQDTMYARDTDIIKIQDGKLAAAQSLLDKQIEIKDQLDKNFQREVDDLELKNDLRKMSVAQAKSVNALAGEYHNVAVEIDKINQLAKNKQIALGDAPAKFKDETDIDFEKRLVEYRNAKAKIEADRLAAAEAAKAAGPKTSAVASTVTAPTGQTGMLAYATGGVVGDGARDSVMAKLTPGEFIMRKASVDKYGKSMLSSMNIGSFEMPRYNTNNQALSSPAIQPPAVVSSITAPVYNTYSVSVNANTNASPDDIANKVMMKIKGIESRSIRSTNGY